MAIQHSKQTDFGLTLTDAYTRINHVFIKDKHSCDVHVETFLNQSVKNEHQPIVRYSFDMEINTQVSWSEIYTHMKTLPEYSDAIDV